MRLATVVLLLTLLLSACGGSGVGEQRLTVFAASSLTDVFTDLAEAFEESQGDARIILNFAATSTLRVQLEQGARADVFASADEVQMRLAQESGLLDGGPVLFAANRLAILVPVESEKIATLQDLGEPGLKLVLGAPQTPIGTYTEGILERIAADSDYGPEFVQRVRDNVVSFGLNARQAVAAVQLGEADAAIAYVTDARAGKAIGLRAVPLPSELAGIALYPVAVIDGSSAPALAQRFLDFLRSEKGVEVLEKHGFGRP